MRSGLARIARGNTVRHGDSGGAARRVLRGRRRRGGGPGPVRAQARAAAGRGDRRGRRPEEGGRGGQPHRDGPRRHHRHRHLRDHRRGDQPQRPGDRPELRAGRHHLRLQRAELLRAGVDDPGLGLGLHLLLRDARRAGGVDHRLGPDPGVRRVGRRGGRRLGRIPAVAAGLAVRHQPAGLDRRPARRRRHVQPAGRRARARRDRAAVRRRAREHPRQRRHGRLQAHRPDDVRRPRRLRDPLPRRRRRGRLLPLRVAWHVGRGRRGRADLLRLHRLRRGLDLRRGGREAATGPADRDRRLAGDRDADLHRRRPRRRRPGAGREARRLPRRRWPTR